MIHTNMIKVDPGLIKVFIDSMVPCVDVFYQIRPECIMLYSTKKTSIEKAKRKLFDESIISRHDL